MRRLILGTAGHIDHGKTALVKALTGVDTDRLKEEKERGITVDLGFAEFRPGQDLHFGVVDVPGHEGFIRNMLAGATGMDSVLLVIAADEGVMPQTREHLAIVRLLGVPSLVVALTKTDLVEEEWLELVAEEISELLSDTPYGGSPIVPVSSVTGRGLDELTAALVAAAAGGARGGSEDVARLPVDRVFTIKGTGTVVTGTLWSGTLAVGDRVLMLPGEREGRIRGLQVHGVPVPEVQAGSRVAVGLTGSGINHQDLTRGQTLVGGGSWEVSWMLTCHLSILLETGWDLDQGQRVRVHLGTAEVLARAALLEGDRIPQGGEGWVQLRLEEPLLARVRDHLVIRSYSPLTTVGGGLVAEVTPRKRRSLASGESEILEARIKGPRLPALQALLALREWQGAELAALPQETGMTPSMLDEDVAHILESRGGVAVEDRIFDGNIWDEARSRILEALRDFHSAEPLRPGLPLEELRQVPPGPFGTRLGEAVLQELVQDGTVRREGGRAALAEFRITLSGKDAALRDRLRERLSQAGLAGPNRKELAEETGNPKGLDAVIRVMEEEGEVLILEGDTIVGRPAVAEGARALIDSLGGKEGLGPAEFREVLDLTRKHLLPLLRYYDTVGVTTRRDELRSVARVVPPGWGTPEGDSM